MTKQLLIGLACLMPFAIANSALGQNSFNGYWKTNGTYVSPHYRTRPDGNRFNNWSTQGKPNTCCRKWGYLYGPILRSIATRGND